MDTREQRVVDRFKLLLSEKLAIREMKVFGSRARGDATEESDLDVLVIVEFLDHAAEVFISECAWQAGFPEDIVVTPIAMTVDDVERSPMRQSSFVQNVLREGLNV